LRTIITKFELLTSHFARHSEKYSPRYSEEKWVAILMGNSRYAVTECLLHSNKYDIF